MTPQPESRVIILKWIYKVKKINLVICEVENETCGKRLCYKYVINFKEFTTIVSKMETISVLLALIAQERRQVYRRYF